MVRRGIAASRAEAGLAIRGGKVTVAGRPAAKAGTMVLAEEAIAVSQPARKFVSRGGEKIEAALDRFGIDVSDRDALDAGASTGGFTDCLLRRGVARVLAVDVGYGQLDWRLREDPRVTVLERTNARNLDPAALPFRASLVTADLSFISLALVVPALAAAAAPEAEFILLVKPQFEAGRADVGSGGVVSDPDVWRRVLRRVADACVAAGLQPVDVMASPLLGPAGNAEFLLQARRTEPDTGPDQGPQAEGFDAAIEVAMNEATALAGGRT